MLLITILNTHILRTLHIHIYICIHMVQSFRKVSWDDSLLYLCAQISAAGPRSTIAHNALKNEIRLLS